jgi:hypothetical protein
LHTIRAFFDVSHIDLDYLALVSHIYEPGFLFHVTFHRDHRTTLDRHELGCSSSFCPKRQKGFSGAISRGFGLGIESNYFTPELVARFDELNEFPQITRFPNETVAVQCINRPYELGIIGTCGTTIGMCINSGVDLITFKTSNPETLGCDRSRKMRSGVGA